MSSILQQIWHQLKQICIDEGATIKALQTHLPPECLKILPTCPQVLEFILISDVAERSANGGTTLTTDQVLETTLFCLFQ